MNRQEFIRLSALFSLGLSVTKGFAQSKRPNTEKVVIIGAGAAGLSCAYFLKQLGIDFILLEASTNHGGRMKSTNSFTNFPIPLGAEWIHSDKNVFNRLISDSETSVKIATKAYEDDASYAYVNGKKLSEIKDQDEDLKFINSTWFDFFEEHITPAVQDQITYKEVVQSINYAQQSVRITTDTETYLCDKVIVTVPVKVLQDGDILFSPPLPDYKLSALKKIKVWEGFKAFFAFKEKFYHTSIEYKVRPKKAGQKLYYDAAYGQKSDTPILGLFTVGKCATAFNGLSPNQIKEKILNELDHLYDGQASKNYIKHIAINWQDEPYIKGAYVNDYEDWQLVAKLGNPIDNKVFFAGGAYTDGEDWENVHTAALSAKKLILSLYA